MSKISPKQVELPSFFSIMFNLMLGAIAANALIGLICITLFGIGYYLIVNNNKENTKPLQELQPLQIVGVGLCLLGCLPFIQYFFFGLLSSLGSSVFENGFE
jgi:hypothetical protein